MSVPEKSQNDPPRTMYVVYGTDTIVHVTASWMCPCGVREVVPNDFRNDREAGTLEVICSICHRTLAKVEPIG